MQKYFSLFLFFFLLAACAANPPDAAQTAAPAASPTYRPTATLVEDLMTPTPSATPTEAASATPDKSLVKIGGVEVKVEADGKINLTREQIVNLVDPRWGGTNNEGVEYPGLMTLLGQYDAVYDTDSKFVQWVGVDGSGQSIIAAKADAGGLMWNGGYKSVVDQVLGGVCKPVAKNDTVGFVDGGKSQDYMNDLYARMVAIRKMRNGELQNIHPVFVPVRDANGAITSRIAGLVDENASWASRFVCEDQDGNLLRIKFFDYPKVDKFKDSEYPDE